MGYEFAILNIAKEFCNVNVLILHSLKWYELDDIDDLKFAENKVVSLINE